MANRKSEARISKSETSTNTRNHTCSKRAIPRRVWNFGDLICFEFRASDFELRRLIDQFLFSLVTGVMSLSFNQQVMVGFGVLCDFIDGGDAVEDFEPGIAAKRSHFAFFYGGLHDLPTGNPVGGELTDVVGCHQELINT